MLRRAAIILITGVCVCGGLLAQARGGVWLDVPFIPQAKDGCGAASVAMVMQYWLKQQGRAPGEAADAIHIQRALYSREEHGIRASDLEQYFEQHQYRVFTFRGEWSDLKAHIEKGRPLVVALKPERGGPLHYVVVAGVDSEQALVMVNDPAIRKLLKQSRAHFERQWKATGYWTLLAVPQAPGE